MTTAMSDNDSLRHVVRDLSQWLEWEITAGLDEFPVEPVTSVSAPPVITNTAIPSPSPRRRSQGSPQAGAAARPGRAGEGLDDIQHDLGLCTRCGLHTGRRNIVFGTGNPRAELVIIGEAPGRQEDLSGEPFVGRAGKLLNRMLQAIGLRRDQVYIANVLKCRPPQNRDPQHEEIASCSPFLHRQIKAIGPKVIMTVGRFASQNIIGSEASMGKLRKEIRAVGGVRVVATYHPAYLLRNPKMKRAAWEDLLKVRAILRDEPIPT